MFLQQRHDVVQVGSCLVGIEVGEVCVVEILRQRSAEITVLHSDVVGFQIFHQVLLVVYLVNRVWQGIALGIEHHRTIPALELHIAALLEGAALRILVVFQLFHIEVIAVFVGVFLRILDGGIADAWNLLQLLRDLVAGRLLRIPRLLRRIVILVFIQMVALCTTCQEL